MGRVCGIIYPDVFQVTNLIEPMMETLALRQEDSGTFQAHHQIQMGQTEKPLGANAKKSILVAVDGAFYHQTELVEKIKKEGRTVNPNSPDQVLLTAYELWGTEFLKEIDGDFAFALLDKEKNRIILGRDRIGKKPLYWYKGNDFFLFASELKALMVTGVIPQTAAIDSIATYLALGYFPQDVTPISSVNKLLPGFYLIYDLNDKSINIQSYWSLSDHFLSCTTDTQEEVTKNLDDALSKAVSQRIVDEPKLGCFVSGGLGSGSIAYYVEKEKKENQEVLGFTSGFMGGNDQDVDAASKIAAQVGITQKKESVEPQNFLDNLVKIIWHLDEPIADPNIIATWELASLAKDVGYVFSGMGSDELLAGHNRYTLQEREVGFFTKLKGKIKRGLSQTMIPILQGLGSKNAFKLLQKSRVNPYLAQYLHQNHLFTSSQMEKASPQLHQLFAPEIFLEKFHKLYRMGSAVSAFIYLDMKTRLPDQFIHQYDRLTHAHGLEWKTPYLDQKIIEYAVKIPEPESLSEFETASYLKNIFKDVFSDEVVNRPKRSRPNFLNQWVVESEISEIFPLLCHGTLVETGFIEEEWLEEVTSTIHLQRRHFSLLFSILVLEIWFRLYINRAVTTVPPEISVKELLLET